MSERRRARSPAGTLGTASSARDDALDHRDDPTVARRLQGGARPQPHH
ncbi:hypothetical protein ABZ915_15595 [Streptomyces sp. NPDC046915]